MNTERYGAVVRYGNVEDRWPPDMSHPCYQTSRRRSRGKLIKKKVSTMLFGDKDLAS